MVYAREHPLLPDSPTSPKTRHPKRKAPECFLGRKIKSSRREAELRPIEFDHKYYQKKLVTTEDAVALLASRGKMGMFHINPEVSEDQIQFTTSIVNSPVYNVRMDETLKPFLKRINQDLSIRGVKVALSVKDIYVEGLAKSDQNG